MLPAAKCSDTERAIEEGARRSQQASSRPGSEPLHVVVWRRGKWWIIGAGLLILEGIVMGTLGGSFARHF